jgi:hypothetical protein
MCGRHRVHCAGCGGVDDVSEIVNPSPTGDRCDILLSIRSILAQPAPQRNECIGTRPRKPLADPTTPRGLFMTDIHDDVAPQLDGYDPTNPMEFVNPFPSWARARVEAPVFFNEILRMLASHPIRGHRTSGTQHQGLQLLGLLLNCEYLRENRDFIPKGPGPTRWSTPTRPRTRGSVR